MTCHITDIRTWTSQHDSSRKDEPYPSTVSATLVVEAPNSGFVRDALAKVLSLLEEEAVRLVFRGPNYEAVTNVIWGDNTQHTWGVVPGESSYDRIKAELELVGAGGILCELHKSLEDRAELLGLVEYLTDEGRATQEHPRGVFRFL